MRAGPEAGGSGAGVSELEGGFDGVFDDVRVFSPTSLARAQLTPTQQTRPLRARCNRELQRLGRLEGRPQHRGPGPHPKREVRRDDGSLHGAVVPDHPQSQVGNV